MRIKFLPIVFCALACFVSSHLMASAVYVKNTASGSGDGSTWANAMGDIQAAIDIAATMEPKGDVYVAGYNDNKTTVYLLTSSIELKEGVSIYGGFPVDGSITDIALRPKADNDENGLVEAWEFEYTTVINGDDKVRCISYSNTYNYLEKAIVDGFYLTKGRANASGNNGENGGGILVLSRGILRNCLCYDNYASSRGGGVYVNDGQVENCCLMNNKALYDGGGIAGGYYGRIYTCLVKNNTAEFASGGGIYGVDATNCTIVNNVSNIGGAGTQGYLTNCIVWRNKLKDGTPSQIFPDSYLIVNSAIEGIAPDWINENDSYRKTCKNNIALNSDNSLADGPGFKDPVNNKWWLIEGSKCINRGDNNAEGLNEITLDVAGQSRIYNANGVIDLGCYESVFKGKASYTINISGPYNYNGKVIEAPSVDVDPEIIDPVFSYRLKAETTYASGLPTEIGEYVIKVNGDPLIWDGSAEADITISVVTPIIIWEQDLTPVIHNDVYELTAISNTGLPVVYEITTGTALIEGNKITFNTKGEVTIKAKQAATGEYVAVEKSMTVYVSDPLVNIPDINFKQALLNNTEINTDGNLNEISIAEAEAFIGTLELRSKNIEDLTGIEAFVNLTGLDCPRNNLASLDVSNNTALLSLDCSGNELETIDVSKNAALVNLDCSNNSFSGETSYNEMSYGSNKALSAEEENVVTLDVTQNLLLEFLACGGNGITQIDVSNNTELRGLILSDSKNYFDYIGRSDGEEEVKLKASGPPTEVSVLQSLDVTNNAKLQVLFIGANTLSELNLHSNTELVLLVCDFMNSMENSNTVKSAVEETSSDLFTSIDLSSNIKLMGLTLFECPFPELDLSANTELIELTLIDIDATELDLSKNINLRSLNCFEMDIETLDLSKNVLLERLDCEGTLLSQLDLSNNVELTEVSISQSNLKSINVNKLHKLKRLWLYGNKLTSLRIHAPEVKLDELSCRNNLLTDIYFYSEETCNTLSCSDNPLPFSELVTIKAPNIYYYYSKKVFEELNEAVGYVVDYSAEVQPGPFKTVFYWFDNDNNPVDETFVKPVEGQSGLFKFLKNGVYYCKMSNQHYDTDIVTHNITISVPTNLPSLKLTELNLYPNPTNGVFNIDLDEEPGSVVQLMIYNLSGQLIDSKKYQQATIEYAEPLNPGIYLVAVHYNGIKKMAKLVVKK